MEDIDARCQESDAFSFQKYANVELRCILTASSILLTGSKDAVIVWFEHRCS